MNNFLLTMKTVMASHSSPFWMTLPQANALDAKVRKGEKSSVVVYYCRVAIKSDIKKPMTSLCP